MEGIMGRVDLLEKELNYFVSLFGSAGALSGVAIAILAVFVAIYSTYMTQAHRRGRRKLRNAEDRANLAVNSLEKKLADLDQRVEQSLQETNSHIKSILRATRDEMTGEIYYNESRFAEALEAFRRSNQLDPSDGKSLYYIGRCLTNLNLLREAHLHFEGGLQRLGDNPYLLRGLALVHRFNDRAMARDLYNRALQTKDVSLELRVKILNELGLVYRDDSDLLRAKACHEEADRIIRDGTLTIYFLGIIDLLMGAENRGKELLLLAKLKSERDVQQLLLKSLWGDIIFWSWAVSEDKKMQARQCYRRIQAAADRSEYLRATIYANVGSVAQALRVNQSEFQ